MPIARNGDVELHYDTFGSAEDPTLLLVNGLGSQSINYAEAWIERFVAEGYHVVRFDNRDTGLSSKLEDQSYGLVDMAHDAIAVLDAVGVERAHVMGCSMGGMIVQRLAIDHPERLLSMTSVMSRTGEAEYGQSSPEALAALVAPPATTREEYVERMVAAQHVYGSKPEWIDDADVARRAGVAFDRCYCPTGTGRQMLAVMADGSRADALREVAVPTLVLHGSRDTLIDPSGGRRTAELIPGARYEEIEGMGHDYPPAVWPTWVRLWVDFAADVVAGG
jgi:pimeloyl-ACP methyl ester carboxylesterase